MRTTGTGSRSQRLAGALALLTALAATADAKLPSCRRACRNLQTNCIDVAHEALTAERDGCAADAATARTCRRTARGTFRKARTACGGLVRRSCRPCCKLGGPNECAKSAGFALGAEPQEQGDAPRGRDILLNGDYMTCGVPFQLWTQDIAPLKEFIANGFAGSADAPRIPGRQGPNADMPYFLNVFTTPGGVEVINANCLMCHGGTFDGELVIGLGNATANFTRGAGGVAGNVPLTDTLLDALGLSAPEKTELRKIAARAAILAPPTMMRTIGMNPAEMLAVILMVHHDRDTLAFSEAEVTPVVFRDAAGVAIPDPRVTSDPPPWWRVHKKNALFYNGMARGDHRGTMALATSVCVDDVPRAEQVDALFKDIQAFVASVEAPRYTRPVDGARAEQGHELFLRDCAGCHGTYGASEAEDTYPNLLVPLDVIGTDPVVANAGVIHAPELVQWYNLSFYGGITRMVPDDPFPGYMPPPLDGIWATAPYLHNGSVPTVELVLNSRARPPLWRRRDLDSRNFDADALGWPWDAVASIESVPGAERNLVYDTTFFSQSNAGHTFGDHLTDDERRAVLEYLKTL
ncbi:MAG TPA: hypothetical protein VKA21_03705 [Candidatus Binatia bacterium]|nr:hypothetical protein [Candidatus Binatia bacterium]